MLLVFLLRELICVLITRTKKKNLMHELDNNLVLNSYYKYYSTAQKKEVFYCTNSGKKRCS